MTLKLPDERCVRHTRNPSPAGFVASRYIFNLEWRLRDEIITSKKYRYGFNR